MHVPWPAKLRTPRSKSAQLKTASAPAPAPGEEPYAAPSYAWYVVGVLTVAYVFSFIDRQILSLLVQPIRRDLEISDTQMSLLMGFSFAVFYSFFGLLLGRLADSRSRRTLIVIGFSLWSLLTAACGLAGNFVQMLLLRMGVGVGEASLSPAAYSLLADYFPPQRSRPGADGCVLFAQPGSPEAAIVDSKTAPEAGPDHFHILPTLLGEKRDRPAQPVRKVGHFPPVRGTTIWRGRHACEGQAWPRQT